jgi:hypothetical protein
MKNKDDNNPENDKRIPFTMDGIFLYNNAVCALSQLNDITQQLETYLFLMDDVHIKDVSESTDIEEVLGYEEDILDLFREAASVIPVADNLVDAYLIHFSVFNDDDGDELLERQKLLIETIKDYKELFNKLKTIQKNKAAMNEIFNEIGGIETVK